MRIPKFPRRKQPPKPKSRALGPAEVRFLVAQRTLDFPEGDRPLIVMRRNDHLVLEVSVSGVTEVRVLLQRMFDFTESTVRQGSAFLQTLPTNQIGRQIYRVIVEQEDVKPVVLEFAVKVIGT